ncbi:MAG TPA: alpha/beta hydrolase [Planctomycetaceae bacterium]|nr:alpha/beta hydrolase [Planctomycetaceae bacterium]
MHHSAFCTTLNRLPYPALLFVLLGCTQAGFAQQRPVAAALPIGAAPPAVQDSRPDVEPRVFWRPQRAPAAFTAQLQPADGAAPNANASPPAQPPSVQSTAPQTTVVAPAVDACECDYWIVSSRHCNGRHAPCNAGCCMSFFHRTSEQCLVPEPREAFLASIRPDRPVCFVVHGSYNWWRDVTAESRRIHRWIRSAAPHFPLQVVFFTWPSDGNMPFLFPVDIAILGRRSAAHGMYLANLMTQLPPDQRVSILGHSHGARGAVAALHVLGGGTLERGQALPAGYSVPSHLRAVLIAAAIDHDWLNPGERYGQALWAPERVLLLRNSRDATLAIYPLRKGLGERALGRNGLGTDDRFALGGLGPKVVELDAQEFATWHHAFSAYHEHPELASAVIPYVYFQDDGQSSIGPALPTSPTAPSGTTPATAPAASAKPAAAPAERESYFPGRRASENRSKSPANAEPQHNAVDLRFEP